MYIYIYRERERYIHICIMIIIILILIVIMIMTEPFLEDVVEHGEDVVLHLDAADLGIHYRGVCSGRGCSGWGYYYVVTLPMM